MKFLYFILFSTLLVSSSIAQVEDRRTREEQQRISERERRIKQIKAVFNQFNQDLPFLPVESGRVGIRSIELKNDKLQSWEVSLIRSFLEESISKSNFDYVEIPEFEKRLISSIRSTDTSFRLINRDPSIEYRYNFDSIQSVVRKYRINQYISVRIDYDDFFGYIVGVSLYNANTISALWSRTYISNEKGLGSPSPTTRTDLGVTFLNNSKLTYRTSGGGDSVIVDGISPIAGDLEYAWQQSSSSKNTLMLGFHGGVRYVYITEPTLALTQTIVTPRVGLDTYLGFLPKGTGYNSTNWINVRLAGDLNINLRDGVFINSSTSVYAFPTDNFGILARLEFNPRSTYIGSETRLQLNTLNFGIGVNVKF
jgi:hypothetical protein